MDPHFSGVIFQTHAAELRRRIAQSFPSWCLLDVRSSAEFARGHVPGSRRMESGGVTTHLPAGTDAGTEFFVVGANPGDPRVRSVSELLKAHGVQRVVEFSGGLAEWMAFGFELDQEAA